MDGDDHKQALRQAYLLTSYQVNRSQQGPAFSLQVGQRCGALDQLLQRLHLHEAAFITACNPRSQALAAGENALRMQLLQGRLQTLGISWLSGQGLPADAAWHAEPSLLALGLPETTAARLAEDFGQYAWIQHHRGEPSRLCFTRLWPGT